MRANIEELTEAQAIEQYTNRFFKPVVTETPAIPAAYDGKYACILALAVDYDLTEQQMDQLEAAIENINGVTKAFCLIGPARLPVDRVPANHNLIIRTEAEFDITPG